MDLKFCQSATRGYFHCNYKIPGVDRKPNDRLP